MEREKPKVFYFRLFRKEFTSLNYFVPVIIVLPVWIIPRILFDL